MVHDAPSAHSEVPRGPSDSALNGLDHIAGDVLCVSCSYNLRGAPEAGDCPECGAPVAATVGRFDLSHAPLDWLESVRVGLALMFATGLLFLMTPCLPPVLFLWLVTGLIGVLRMTVPEPGRRYGTGARIRKALRVGASVAPGVLLLGSISWGAGLAGQGGAFDLAGYLVYPVALLAWIALTCALCVFYESLAIRMPPSRLQMHARVTMVGTQIVLVGCCIWIACCILIFLLHPVISAIVRPNAYDIALVLLYLGGIALVIAQVVAMLLGLITTLWLYACTTAAIDEARLRATAPQSREGE